MFLLPNTAGIYELLKSSRLRGNALELPVVDQQNKNARALDRGAQIHVRDTTIGQAFRETFQIRFDDENLARMAVRQCLRDMQRRASTQIVDIRLEGESETRNAD